MKIFTRFIQKIYLNHICKENTTVLLDNLEVHDDLAFENTEDLPLENTQHQVPILHFLPYVRTFAHSNNIFQTEAWLLRRN